MADRAANLDRALEAPTTVNGGHTMLLKTILASSAIAGAASAQTGVLDQISPWELTDPAAWIASFNLGDPGLIWQQQIRAGLDGRLEGVAVFTDGAAEAEFAVRASTGSPLGARAAQSAH